VNEPTLFSFTPMGGHVECSAYSPVFKAIAMVIATAALLWGWQMLAQGHLELTLHSSGWIGAALCMMLYTEWHILRGKTTLDSLSIQQTWVWHKRVNLNELAYVKLIRLRGFEWLIAPRLYTKTFSNKLTVFYASSSTMLSQLEALEAAVKQQREKL